MAALLNLRRFISWANRVARGSGSQDDVVPQSTSSFDDEYSHDTFFGKFVDQIKAPGDEENPIKAVKEICATHAENRIQLRENDDAGIRSEFLKDLGGFFDATDKLRNDPKLAFAVLLAIAFFLTMLGVGVYASVVSADLVDGSIVAFGFHKAGDWEVDIESAGFMFGDGAVIAENRQSRIWAYKSACYGSNDGNSPEACGVYYQRQLPFRASPNATCPFDGDACLFGTQSAYKVTTGLLDSNILGVNAPISKRFHFSRTISCAPLKTDDYVFSSGNSSFPNQWIYDYGPSFMPPLPQYTYLTPREWRIAAEFNTIPPYRMG